MPCFVRITISYFFKPSKYSVLLEEQEYKTNNQFIACILRDKLPDELDKEDFLLSS